MAMHTAGVRNMHNASSGGNAPIPQVLLRVWVPGRVTATWAAFDAHAALRLLPDTHESFAEGGHAFSRGGNRLCIRSHSHRLDVAWLSI